MKSTAKVIAKPTTAKTIDLVRGMNATRNTSLYKMISTEVDKSEELDQARDDLFNKQYLVLAKDKAFKRNLKKKPKETMDEYNARNNVVIKYIDIKSASYDKFVSDVVCCLLTKYCDKAHNIKGMKLASNAGNTMRIVAAMQMTDTETRALPETDDKYRIRIHCQAWIRKAKSRLLKYCERRLKAENDVKLGLNAKPTAKGKGKGKADLANKGKGITADQIIALMINGCAKLSKDKAEEYLDRLADQIESLRKQVNDGKQIMECEA